MKKTALSLVMAWGVSMSLFSQIEPLVMTYGKKLNGTVKSITLTEYDIVKKVWFINFRKKYSIEQFQLDSNGEVTQWSICYPPNKSRSIEKYRRDDKGNVIESISLNSEGDIFGFTVNHYDSRGNYTGSDDYSSDSTLNFCSIVKYNQFNEAVERITFEEDGKLMKRETVKTDLSGANRELAWYNSSNKLIDMGVMNYQIGLDHANFYYYTNKDSIPVLNSYTYNEMGIVAEVVYTNSKTGESSTKVYEYDKFDKENNWCRELRIFNGKLDGIIKKKIEYY